MNKFSKSFELVSENTGEVRNVTFSVYKPNAERTKVEPISSYTCRQNEFVNLLKTGSFADENGELITVLS